MAGGSGPEGPEGYSYAAVLVRGRGRDEVVDALRELRFSGWVTPEDGGWVPCVAAHEGTVAVGRRGPVGVGASLAERLGAVVLVFRVVSDRQLVLAGWDGAEELGRYVSDPSFGLPASDPTLPDPFGAELAVGLAAACGRPDSAAELEELLDEELDPDSVIESERLTGVLRLLGLPSWLVAVSSLPKDVPTGPRAADVLRLGAGSPGLAGVLRGRAADVVRGRRPPPPDVTDVPRGSGPDIPWELM